MKAPWEEEYDKDRDRDPSLQICLTSYSNMGRARERQSQVMGNTQRQSGNQARWNLSYQANN